MTQTIKFLYSYGGQIFPRPIDGKLRYVGGSTRVLSIDRSVTFSELMVKFGESCGSSMNLKCKLPTEDLDVLISIRSNEDLKNVIKEYERASPEEKIRAVLFPIISSKKISSPSSPISCFDFPSPPKPVRAPSTARYYSSTLNPPPYAATYRCGSPMRGYQGRSSMQFYHVQHHNDSH